MPLVAGTRLGPYEICSPLGTGGMGEVYRARDTKLRREVALKIVPAAFAQDHDRMARFEREAQLLAALNHPNIAQIYGVEDSLGGISALVMELVSGPTLAELIAKGPMPVCEALSLAKQVAEALESAHERGIIHRDLKPDNVKLTSDGVVKVLDFGLAKALEGEGRQNAAVNSATMAIEPTAPGMILGTASYMSPEQARGRPLDKRTDIWAFGCLLYETLAGRKAFPGDTATDTMAAVLDREPDWGALPNSTPAQIRLLLERCLRKDPKQRLHDMGDARIEIEEVLRSPAKDKRPDQAVAQKFSRWAIGAAGLAGLLAGALLLWSIMRAGSAAEASVPHLGRFERLTHDPDYSGSPTWSPDGTMLAFSSNRSGNYEIYVRRVQGGQEVNITNDPGQDIQPAFSPDGNWIAFVSTRSSRTGLIHIGSPFAAEFRTVGGDIWLVPTLGGQARLLARDGNVPVWHPGGNKVLYVSGPENHRALMDVATDGSAPRAVLPKESSDWEIIRAWYSPSGRWITFETYERQILIMPAGGGQPRLLLKAVSHVWDASGRHIYYCSPESAGGTRLLSAEIDESAGKVKGDFKTVGLVTAILSNLAISHDGLHLAATEMNNSLNLTRLPLNAFGDAPAGPEEVLSRGEVFDRAPAVSSDNKVVAHVSNRLGEEEIWLLHLDTKRLERLQLPGHDFGEWGPRWLPHGRQLLVMRMSADQKSSVWSASADGSHAEEIVPSANVLNTMVGISVSADGRMLTYSLMTGGSYQLVSFDTVSRQSKQLTFMPGDKYEVHLSPDGRWLVYSSNAGGSVNLWKIPAEGGTPEQLTKGDDRIRHMFYSPDGKWLYFQPNHQNIYRMPTSGGPVHRVTHFQDPDLFVEEPSISPDGKYIYYSRSHGGSSLWLFTITTGSSPLKTEN
jgi:eukaryotic-like serine/threonine-protein kinase